MKAANYDPLKLRNEILQQREMRCSRFKRKTDKSTMASDKNQTPQEEQNAIENLNGHLTEAGQRLADNKKVLYWVLSAIVCVALFCAAWFYFFRNPNLNKSWEAVNKVMLQSTKGELTDSAANVAFQKVAESYSGDAATVAAIAAAEGFYDNGKYDAAIKNLEGLSVSEPVMAAQVKVLLGDCYVNKGDKFYSKALEAYQSALKKADSNPQIVPVVLIKMANVYDAQKDYAKALDCYEQIKTGYPKFAFGNGMTVEAYIAREKARLGK